MPLGTGVLVHGIGAMDIGVSSGVEEPDRIDDGDEDEDVDMAMEYLAEL
jgi:hypothetical protein